MYLTKEKRESNLYVSHAISRDISKHMQGAIKSMSAMIVHGLIEGGEDHG